MGKINRVNLFGKLNSLAYQSIEAATVFCKLRGNPYVELVHWYAQILQLKDTDLHRILKHFDVNNAHLARDITAALDRLPRGATAISDLSIHLEEAVERGWVFGTLMFGEGQVRTGHLLFGCLKTASLNNVLLSISREFSKIGADPLSDAFASIVGGSSEEGLGAQDGSRVGAAAPGEDSKSIAPPQMGKQEALKRFTVDLTENARSKKMDPIVGRDEEIR